jgi:hypothetical protein
VARTAVVSPSPLRLSSGANGKRGNRPKGQDVIEPLGSNCMSGRSRCNSGTGSLAFTLTCTAGSGRFEGLVGACASPLLRARAWLAVVVAGVGHDAGWWRTTLGCHPSSDSHTWSCHGGERCGSEETYPLAPLLQRTRFLGLERTFFATPEGFAASSVFVFSRHPIPPVTLSP